MANFQLNWQNFRKNIVKAEVTVPTNLTTIRNVVQNISDQMKTHNQAGYVGVAIHYKKANHWTPSIFTPFGTKIKTFSQDIYFGDTDVYAGDKPDRFTIYINKDGNQQYQTPTKLDTDTKKTKNKTKK